MAAAASAALRAWLPRGGGILSIPGVLVELADSPVFYLSLAFAVSWSLLGLRVRAPGPRARSDRWSSLPLLVWSLLGNRHQESSSSASGFHDFPPSATLPTFIQDRTNRQGITIHLLALLPVAVVLVDWAMSAGRRLLGPRSRLFEPC